MFRQSGNDGTSVKNDWHVICGSFRLAFIPSLILACIGDVAAEEFVDTYIREHRKGYHARPCGFDMDRDGVIGEQADAHVGDGRTADPDGDGVNEDLIYVDADGGSDETGNGAASAPYKTVYEKLGITAEHVVAEAKRLLA